MFVCIFYVYINFVIFQQIVEELKAKISECLQKGLPVGDCTRLDSGTAESQDSEDGESKPKLQSRTPGRRQKIVPRTPASKYISY